MGGCRRSFPLPPPCSDKTGKIVAKDFTVDIPKKKQYNVVCFREEYEAKVFSFCKKTENIFPLTVLEKNEGFETVSYMNKKLSKISVLHYCKLILRSLIFLTAFIAYLWNSDEEFTHRSAIPTIVWFFFVVEMFFRFFPSKWESMGCQKQFRKNYIPIEIGKAPINQSPKQTAAVAAAWLALNGVIGILYFFGILDRGILILIALGFSVCDIVCILFFCPFQTWFMKNRCCTTCRIYNWDFAMMFTPLALIPNLYTYSLLGCALALLLRWEITYRLHPERFSTATNQCLDCSRCEEKLCSHKKQLRSFLQTYKNVFFPFHESDRKK